MKIKKVVFRDQSQFIHYEASDYGRFADELEGLQERLCEMEELKNALSELERAVREGNSGKIKGALQSGAADVLTGTLAGIASGALLEFLKRFAG